MIQEKYNFEKGKKKKKEAKAEQFNMKKNWAFNLTLSLYSILCLFHQNYKEKKKIFRV